MIVFLHSEVKMVYNKLASTVRPHLMFLVHKMHCGLLPQMSHVVCVSLCVFVLVIRMYYANAAGPIKMPFGGGNSYGSKNLCIR